MSPTGYAHEHRRPTADPELSPALRLRAAGLGQNLTAYIQAVGFERWRWGTSDCCTFGAGWVETLTGVDPLAEFRGQYGSALDAARLVNANGGLARMIRERLPAHREILAIEGEPDDGDIAVVASGARVGRGIGFGVIVYRAGWWIARAQRGLRFMRVAPEFYWRIST